MVIETSKPVGPLLADTIDEETRHFRHEFTLATVVCSLLLAALLYVPALMQLDFLWLDKLTVWRASQQTGDPDIVIVDIDDYSLQGLAPTLGRWPWPRATHAELVEWLAAQQVSATAFDIWFSEPDVLRPEFDAYFGEVMATQPRLYLPTLLMDTTDKSRARLLNSYPPSLPLQKNPGASEQARADLLLPAMGDPAHWHLGLVNFLEDRDGIARHYRLVSNIEGWSLLSLPYVLARDLQLNDTLPTAGQQQEWRLDWQGKPAYNGKPYTTLSYADLWQKMQTGEQDSSLAGKLVLIGSTAAGLHDLRPTPLAAQYSGLYILANTVDNLKNRQQLYYTPETGLLAGLLLLLWLGWRLRSEAQLQRTAVWFAVFAVGMLIASGIAITWRWLVPVLSPLFCAGVLLAMGSVLRYMEEREAREATIDMFGRFLDPLVVEQLARDGLTRDTLEGKTCDISVLFSDIRGFTSMSEKATAAEIMSLLNAYFSRQVNVIFQHQGTLDKFIGDAIMAFWGAPVTDPDHAIHAVSAALDMVDELLRFRDERGLEHFDVGIGIHSGPAVVGMLGSAQRLEYTAIGDTVNLGSRLEGVTKGVARILVSQTTRDACGNAFDFISHGAVTVKGREEPVNIFEPRRKPS